MCCSCMLSARQSPNGRLQSFVLDSSGCSAGSFFLQKLLYEPTKNVVLNKFAIFLIFEKKFFKHSTVAYRQFFLYVYSIDSEWN